MEWAVVTQGLLLRACSDIANTIFHSFASLIGEKAPKFNIRSPDDFKADTDSAQTIHSKMKQIIAKQLLDIRKSQQEIKAVNEKCKAIQADKSLEKFTADTSLKLRKSYKTIFRRCKQYQKDEKEIMLLAHPEMKKLLSEDISMASFVNEFILKFPIYM